ncbi:enolase N-terminal-like fold-containing protein, partial [Methanobacterium sp.]
MKLIDELIESGRENDSPVRDVRAGVSWTGVHGKYGGVCKTYGIPVAHGNYTKDMGEL